MRTLSSMPSAGDAMLNSSRYCNGPCHQLHGFDVSRELTKLRNWATSADQRCFGFAQADAQAGHERKMLCCNTQAIPSSSARLRRPSSIQLQNLPYPWHDLLLKHKNCTGWFCKMLVVGQIQAHLHHALTIVLQADDLHFVTAPTWL